MATNIFDGLDAGFFGAVPCVFHQVRGEKIEHVLQGFIEFQLGLSVGVAAVHVLIGCVEEGNFGAQKIEIDQVGFETVVEVRGVVGDFVHEIDQLRFQRRALVEQIFGELRKFSGGVIARMFDDAFANFES